jgi:murein DD-endopeptidase MepM/ murein hydrolase activator NlpD
VRRWRGLLVALAAFAFFVGQVAPAAADPDEDRLAQLAREKQELERAAQVSRQNAERYRQEANRFQAAVNAANARITDLAGRQALAQTEADILKIEIEISEEQLALVAFQLSETASLIDSLKAQTAEQTKQLVSRQDLYAMHLRTTYRQAQVSPLEMLLSSRSLTEFSSRVQAMVLINRQDQQLVRDIQTLKGSTAQKEAAIVEKGLEIKGLQSQIETQKASLAKKKADHERIVAEMKASISTQSQLRTEAAVNRNNAIGAQQQANAETARLNRQLEQTEAAYARLAAELALRSGLGAFNGRMAIWPVNGAITSYYGPRWGGFHNGLDVAAPLNTPIRAAAAGQVVTVGKPYLAYGDTATVVIIAHGSNFSTLYGHMSDAPGPTVRVGQVVRAGDRIGYVGMTGWTTGPHVHFMTVVDGRTVDPLPYMPR